MAIVPLPFSTFASIADAGWRIRVYCPSCYRWKPVDVDAALRPRVAFHARFRCTNIRPVTRMVCNGLGHLKIEPPAARPRRAQLGRLACGFAAVPWAIEDIVLEEPPWPRLTNQNRFRCPGCQGVLGVHFYGGTHTPDITFIDHASARR